MTGHAGEYLKCNPTETGAFWDNGSGPPNYGYTTVLEDGVAVPQRHNLDFIDFFTVTDNGTNTEVTLNVVTLAGDSTFVTNLVDNTSFTTYLAGDTNFINTITNNSLFVTNVTTIINNPSSGTLIPLANGGTNSVLTDPVADRLWGWDDTDNAIGFWTIGSGLSYDHATHTLSATGTGTQTGIQFQDEGTNLGTSGTVDTVDFVGAGVTTTRATNTVTVTIPSASTIFSITQTAHGFAVGDIIRTTTNQWTKSLAVKTSSTDLSAETFAIVITVPTANSFTAQPLDGSRITDTAIVALVSTYAGGTPLFLDDTTAGTFTDVEPTASTSVSKPIGYVETNSSGTPIALCTVNYRGLTPGGDSVFGAWDDATYSINTTYQAPADGFVEVLATYTAGGSATGSCEILTDANPTPTTKRAGGIQPCAAGSSVNNSFVIMCPVKKNEYFKAVGATANFSYSVAYLPYI